MSNIHYHGGPIWGGDEIIKALYGGGCSLVSFWRPEQTKKIAKLDCSLVLDNGAFSRWKKSQRDGVELTGCDEHWTKFYTFVLRWFSRIDWFLIPDVITGSEADNDRLINRVPSALISKAVPVWHTDEPLEKFVRLCTRFERVAIGCCGDEEVIRSKASFNLMNHAFSEIYIKRNLKTKIHGFRMLDGRALSKFPFDSADSTNVSINVPKDKKKFPQVKGKLARTAVLRAAIESVFPPTIQEWVDSMGNNFITIFHNAAILPVNESERIDCDPSCYMGEPTYCAGSLKVWSVGDLRVILPRSVLTSAP